MVTIINDTEQLALFCNSLIKEAFITIDTEFMRERTYYPELCLIQVAGSEVAMVIDPLAKGIDLAPLNALFANENIVKVFHACRQDMEIFYYQSGVLPKPIFDTQIAAMVCGFGESVSYENIVNRLTGIAVDKSSRFTDWSKRPLTDKQLVYALDDVIHLRTVYIELTKLLAENNRAHWIESEMHFLSDTATYAINPDEVWRKLRFRNTTPRYLGVLRAVARWRELAARAKNVPRSRIMKDETLTEVANACPQDYAELQAIRGFSASMKTEHYLSLFDAIKEAQKLLSSDYPRLPPRPQYAYDIEPLVDLLKLLLKKCASDNNIVPRLLADKEELEQLASGKYANLPCLSGWRNEIFGYKAMNLLQGKVAIKADGEGSITFIALE